MTADPGDESQRRSPKSIQERRHRLVTALDLATVVLTVLALSVTFFGGLRFTFGWRLSFTSPLRGWLWVAAVLVLRHRLVRNPSVFARLRDLVIRLRRSDDVRRAWVVTLGSRLPLLLVGYLAVVTIGFGKEPPFRVSSNELWNLPLRWDSGWYVNIATEGYHWLPDRPNRQQSIVFFPAYPLLLRLGTRLLGDRPGAIGIVGLLLSLTAFCGALVYFRRLARDKLDEPTTDTALWLLAAYPFAVFYGAVYTESLFLLATLGAFVEFRRDRLTAAAGWGLLAGLTRPNGCLLSVVLATGLLEREWSRRRAARVLTAAMPGLGMLIYSACTLGLTGSPFEWARGHVAWGRTLQQPFTALVQRYEQIASGGLYEYTSMFPIDALNLAAVLLAIVSIWPVARRWGTSCALLVAMGVFVPLASGGLISIGRMTSVLFPVFLWLAEVVPVRMRSGWIVAFAMLQTFNAVLFFTWRHMV